MYIFYLLEHVFVSYMVVLDYLGTYKLVRLDDRVQILGRFTIVIH